MKVEPHYSHEKIKTQIKEYLDNELENNFQSEVYNKPYELVLAVRHCPGESIVDIVATLFKPDESIGRQAILYTQDDITNEAKEYFVQLAKKTLENQISKWFASKIYQNKQQFIVSDTVEINQIRSKEYAFRFARFNYNQ